MRADFGTRRLVKDIERTILLRAIYVQQIIACNSIRSMHMQLSLQILF